MLLVRITHKKKKNLFIHLMRSHFSLIAKTYVAIGTWCLIQATNIDIEEHIDTLSTMVRKSVQQFQDHIKKYTAAVTERIKCATQRKNDYGLFENQNLDINTGCCSIIMDK